MLFSVIAHEYAHGYAALKQGDTTALSLGRLTWNPLKHIDLWLTIVLPAVLLYVTHGRMALGGAKPVPVDPRNYRNRRRGDIIVSLAGVTTNLIIATFCAALVPIIGLVGRSAAGATTSLAIVQAMLLYGIYLNLALVAFNLIPVPPLDGSHVMKYLLPPAWSVHYQRIGFLGLAILLLLMQTNFLTWWFRPVDVVMNWLYQPMSGLILRETLDWFRA